MSKAACPRLFEVEAMRDGRLAGAERASFERHLRGCVACAREAEALEALARAVRESASSSEERDELHARRERTRLLAAFDQELVREDGPRRGWLVPLAGLALAAGVLVVWRVSSSSGPSDPPVSPPP